MNRLRLCQMYMSHIQLVIVNSSMCTIYKSSVSPGFAKIMPILFILCYNGSLFIWTVVSLTAAKFSLLYFLSLASPCPMLLIWSFWWFCVAYTILLCNRIHMEGWEPYANRGRVCTFENFQWCGEPCLVGAAILIRGCLPQIHRRGRHRLLLI
jgi:hypothetical protein